MPSNSEIYFPFSFSKPTYYFPLRKINIGLSFKHWSLKFSQVRCLTLKKGKIYQEELITVTAGVLVPSQEEIIGDALANLS